MNLKKRKKIMLVFGTRPEAIKLAPLIHKFKSKPDLFELIVCNTAQHREMLDQVLSVFEIKPNFDLNIMRPNQDLFDITTKILNGLKTILSDINPDVLLVHGDTTTTMAASLAGFYKGIEIGHIEAGLRTNNIYAPFPEEFNRLLTSKIANWHFAPTDISKKNLIAEGVLRDRVIVTGNTVIDSLHWTLNKILKDQTRLSKVIHIINQKLSFDWENKPFVLVTGHRRENFGIGFQNICEAISELAEKFNDIQFVYPLHMNPNVQKPVKSILKQYTNIHLIDPLDYEPFIYFLRSCYVVLTDSGGIQEEAPSLGKPVLVMRDVTERPEAVQAGTVKMVGTDKKNIIQSLSQLIEDKSAYKRMSMSHNPYGDGKASERILRFYENR